MANSNWQAWLVLFSGEQDQESAALRLCRNLLQDVTDQELGALRIPLSNDAGVASRALMRLADAKYVLCDLTGASPEMLYYLGALDLLADRIVIPLHAGEATPVVNSVFGGRVVAYDPANLAEGQRRLQKILDGANLEKDDRATTSVLQKRLGRLRVERAPSRLDTQNFVTKTPPLPGPVSWRVPVKDGGEAPTTFGLWWGDIRELKSEHGIDALINSENTYFEMARMHDFGLSAIVRSMGANWNNNECDDAVYRELIAAAEALPGKKRPWPEGAAILTGAGGELKKRGVTTIAHVAAVKPRSPRDGVRAGVGYTAVANLEACVDNALGKLWTAFPRRPKNAKTILLPLIATGNAQGNPRFITRRIISSAVTFVREHPHPGVKEIKLLARTDLDYEVCQDAFAELGSQVIA